MYCQQSYSQNSGLSKHNKTASHIERMKSKSVDDPLIIHQKTVNIYICEDIKEEVKEEEIVDDPLFILEGNRSKYDNICKKVKEEGIVNDEIYIVEHKIEIYN
jgi:hypothetical protein